MSHIPVYDDGSIDAQPCTLCGELTLSVLDIVDGDEVIDERFVCRACKSGHFAEADALRVKFDALIAGGMSREMANRVIIVWHLPR